MATYQEIKEWYEEVGKENRKCDKQGVVVERKINYADFEGLGGA
jgi:hypothetical protein